MDANYTVVEHVGLETESELVTFASFIQAVQYRRKYYSDEEIQSMSVKIKMNYPDFSEYID